MILAALPDDVRKNHRAITEYAISLGYMPAIKGARKDYADFTNNKLKRTILKIKTDPRFTYLQAKFYAVPDYSAYFQEAIDDRISTWHRLKYDYKCFGCGKCSGTEGYSITLPDGRKGFLCGFGLLPLPVLKSENVNEVKEALRVQHEYFFNKHMLTNN